MSSGSDSASTHQHSPSKTRSTKRMHLWSSARRLSGLKRSKSSPSVRAEGMETSPKSVEREWREDDLKEKDEDEEPRDAFEVNGNAREDNTNVWTDDAESTHTAFKEDVITSKFEDDGDWAPNLFYAYARRTDDPRFSRFLLTFSTARVCAEWWSLLQQHFGGSPSNAREGPQFFSFTGDDIPGRAWKHASFSHLRTKWMYSQLGDAVGAMGKGQEIIPLQDERGWSVVQQSAQESRPRAREESPEFERAPSRGSFTDSLGQKEKDKMARSLKRSSKRDSGILLPSSPLINNLSHHERSHSLPVLPPDGGGGGPSAVSAPTNSSFDFERMEQNLARIERLIDANASQLRSLEHVQAANLERLTAALVSNADMIRELGAGQMRLGEACDELRRAVKDRDEKAERMSLRSVESVGSSSNSMSACTHDVKRGPRKIGRTVVGYVYADGPNGEGVRTIVPAKKEK